MSNNVLTENSLQHFLLLVLPFTNKTVLLLGQQHFSPFLSPDPLDEMFFVAFFILYISSQKLLQICNLITLLSGVTGDQSLSVFPED